MCTFGSCGSCLSVWLTQRDSCQPAWRPRWGLLRCRTLRPTNLTNPSPQSRTLQRAHVCLLQSAVTKGEAHTPAEAVRMSVSPGRSTEEHVRRPQSRTTSSPRLTQMAASSPRTSCQLCRVVLTEAASQRLLLPLIGQAFFITHWRHQLDAVSFGF